MDGVDLLIAGVEEGVLDGSTGPTGLEMSAQTAGWVPARTHAHLGESRRGPGGPE
jgi:hypothetical protein